MGTYIGHVLPGLFFALLSFWWVIQFAYERVALDRGRRAPRGRILSRLHQLPIEGSVVLAVCVIGFVGENMHPYPKWKIYTDTGEFAYAHIWQHCQMYTFFGMYALVNIMSKTCLPNVDSYRTLVGSLAFFVEAMLFHFHIVGREAIDIHLHVLLVLAIGGCTVSSLGETFVPSDDRFRVCRFLFTTLQGTWLIQTGTVLYRPPSGVPWDDDSKLNIMFLTEAFGWHILCDVIILSLLYCLALSVLQRAGCGSVALYRKINGVVSEDLEGNVDHGMTNLLKNGEPNNRE